MPRLLLVVLLTALVTPALAGPPDGSPEAAIRSSLQLIRDDQLDRWITEWCASDVCRNTLVNEEMKEFGLARAHANAATCLHGADEAIEVTRTKGDAEKGPVTLWIRCAEERMPVPATLVREDGRWKVKSFSW